MGQLSIRSKAILTLLLIGLACLAAGGIIGYLSGAEALTNAVTRQLTAQRELKRLHIESYIRDQLRFTQAVGSAPQTTAAAQAMIDAFRGMHNDLTADPEGMKVDTAVLQAWYTKSFLPRIDKIAGSHTPLEGLMPSDPVGRRLQADYIARNSNPPDQKDQLLEAPGGSRYDVAHAEFHGISITGRSRARASRSPRAARSTPRTAARRWSRTTRRTCRPASRRRSSPPCRSSPMA